MQVSTLIVLLALCSLPLCYAGSITGNYTDPAYFTSVPWGSRSHWMQPWRGWLETPLATAFTQNLGYVMTYGLLGTNVSLIAQQLAMYGFNHVRIEIGWGSLQYATNSLPLDSAGLQFEFLSVLPQFNVRPLILINVNDGGPCPYLLRTCTLLANANVGDTSIQLSNVADLAANPTYSGISEFIMAEAIFTSISGTTVQLSSPILASLTAGQSVTVATLKFRPFAPFNSTDFANTVAGFRQYLDQVANYTAIKLGTSANVVDRGFDLEIYNELTFGQHYLDINNYYTVNPYAYPNNYGGPFSGPNYILIELVQQAAQQVTEQDSALYGPGVRLPDGFPNTQPWTSSAIEPPRVHALNKHPYRGYDYFNVPGHPDSTQGSTPINALMQVDTSGFEPSYTSVFPEYYGNVLQTETLLRDSGPILNTIPTQINTTVYSLPHGRFARSIFTNDSNDVVPVWVTEWSIFCNEVLPSASDEVCQYLQAKNYLRFAVFFIHKGVERIYFFGAGYGDAQGGIVSDFYVNYTKTAKAYPANDTAYVSPTLRVFSRVIARMQLVGDASNITRRSLQLNNVSDTHNHYQFAGNGTNDPAHPPLYNREVFVFLPYQTANNSFTIFYYVMTRNTAQLYNSSATGGAAYDMPHENYTIVIDGIINPATASVQCYDPFTDASVPFTVVSTSPTSLSLEVVAYDNPAMLKITDSLSAAPPGSTSSSSSSTPSTSSSPSPSATSSPATATTGGRSHSSSGLHWWAILLIVIGVLLAVGAVVAAVVFVMRRRQGSDSADRRGWKINE